MTALLVILLIVVPLAVLGRLGLAVYRFARMTPRARRHYFGAWRAKLRWRWLCRNQELAYTDSHRRRALHLKMWGTAVRVHTGNNTGKAWLRYPKAKFRADHYGITAKVKTIPRTGSRQDFEEAAEHIANSWRCARVQVAQRKPGRLIVRGVRVDPLTEPYADTEAPARRLNPRRPELYLGRDEWGNHRWLPLAGITGITVGGLAGFGKTEFVLWLLGQLAGIPSRFVLIDGKGSYDYESYRDEAWMMCGDDLNAASGILEGTHDEMRRRLGAHPGNGWDTGPTLDLPYLVTVIDECHTFFDLDSAKGLGQTAEKQVRACRHYTGQMVRKQRSVLGLTILMTQKQTSDAIPTVIRDNCRAGFSFAVKTRDAAVAGLGEQIRDYQSYCPTSLQDPAYVGVCTAALRTGADPFVRIRVPQLTKTAARIREHETAGV